MKQYRQPGANGSYQMGGILLYTETVHRTNDVVEKYGCSESELYKMRPQRISIV